MLKSTLINCTLPQPFSPVATAARHRRSPTSWMCLSTPSTTTQSNPNGKKRLIYSATPVIVNSLGKQPATSERKRRVSCTSKRALFQIATRRIQPQEAVTAVVNELGLKRRRVNEWAEKFDWEATL